MNIVIEVLNDYPTEFEDAFQSQFSDWSSINEFGNIDPIELKLKQVSEGSDRIVYETKHPEILLKAAFGPQQMVIPTDFEFLYLPVYEFQFPVPLQDPNYQDGRAWGQFQLKITPYVNYKQSYMPTRNMQKAIHSVGCDVGFAKAIITHYGQEVLDGWISAFKQYNGMRAPSSQNWGYYNEKPIIFDYGMVIE